MSRIIRYHLIKSWTLTKVQFLYLKKGANFNVHPINSINSIIQEYNNYGYKISLTNVFAVT